MLAPQTLAFVVEGGIGKVVASTQVAASIKAANPEARVVVACGWPDIYLNNPHVDRLYDLRNPQFFYDDCVVRSRVRLLKVEPYQHERYLYQELPLIDAWCEMVGVPNTGGGPEVFLSDGELQVGKAAVARSPRPVVLLHTEGGKLPEQADDVYRRQAQKGMHTRSLSFGFTQKLISLLSKKYHIVVVTGQNQHQFTGCDHLTGKLRDIMAFLPHVAKIVCIDSFIMHAAAALKRPAIVLWGGTNPSLLGYAIHNNQTRDAACPTPHCHRPNSFFNDILQTGDPWMCPHGQACMEYDPEAVAKLLEA
jgi:hypothetical protein